MSIRRRLVTAIATAAAAFGFAALAAGPATAAPYDDAVLLSWDNVTFTPSTTETFFGLPVAVPGDTGTRSVWVKNDGPSAGTLTATIENVRLAPAADAVFDDLSLEWTGGDSTFADLSAAGETQILSTSIAQGAVVEVPLTYVFPEASVEGNFSNGDVRRVVIFDVVFEISGQEPTPSPSPTGDLPGTGADVAGSFGVAAALMLGGGIAVIAARRRRRTHQD